MNPAFAAARRRKLAQKIKQGVVLLLAAPAKAKSRDVYYPYRQDSYFYYLTACNEENTALLMAVAHGKIQDEVFLCLPKNPHTEQWNGKRLNPTAAKRRLQFDHTADIDTLKDTLHDYAAQTNTLYCLPGDNPTTDGIIAEMARGRRANNRAGGGGITTFVDVSATLNEMRLIKDADEITHIRNACTLTANGIKAAMRTAPRVANECEVEAEIIKIYRAAGGRHAFSPIVASGANACTLHYITNAAKINKHALLLVDSGAELNGYAGDITRTFPANGQWSAAALTVYKIVLSAQKKAIAAARAGVRWSSIETAATRQLAAGLSKIGLCRGSVAAILQKESYRRFYPHRVGHQLGLDVHDVGVMQTADGKARILQAGMVLTIEPGLYIPTTNDIPPQWRGIGVRIEDNILITKSGNTVLTAAVPKEPRDISEWMRG